MSRAKNDREHVRLVIERLRMAHPDANCELDYQTTHQLLVATILSAQCTDVRVNQVTPALFSRYPTPADFAGADRHELEQLIRPTGFFRQKARYIQESASRIVHEYGGQVPGTMEELLTLPGVARKTANVVLGECFSVAAGIVVDTHVKRVSRRLGLVTESDPVKIEQDLIRVVPQASWTEIGHLLIFHGRRICKARSPACDHCPLSDICPSAGIIK